MMNEMNEFKCADLGMDCNFEVRDHSFEELMHLVDTHGARSHGYPAGSLEKDQKIRAAVKKYRLV
jgi:predicted small metal-binding protein